MRFHLVSRDIERANLTRELRLRTLFLLAEACRGVPGDYAEVGVYKGRSAQLIGRAAPEKRLHLFDTFEGMPQHDPIIDGHSAGEFADTSVLEVVGRLKDVRAFEIHRGIFPTSLDDRLRERTFAFAHFDCDLYRPCVDFINFFWPRMSTGGCMVFDDYDWPQCRGVKKAIDEAGLDVVEAVDYQAVVFKRLL